MGERERERDDNSCINNVYKSPARYRGGGGDRGGFSEIESLVIRVPITALHSTRACNKRYRYTHRSP